MCKPIYNIGAPAMLTSNAQNFYVLKINLNLFEISNWVLKFENLIQIWNNAILSENLFQKCIYPTE